MKLQVLVANGDQQKPSDVALLRQAKNLCAAFPAILAGLYCYLIDEITRCDMQKYGS